MIKSPVEGMATAMVSNVTDNGKENRDFAAGDVLCHFKGGLYVVKEIVKHTETGEQMLVYQALYTNYKGEHETFTRPLDMALEEVDHEKYPYSTQKYRLEKVELLRPMWEEVTDRQQGNRMSEQEMLHHLDQWRRSMVTDLCDGKIDTPTYLVYDDPLGYALEKAIDLIKELQQIKANQEDDGK